MAATMELPATTQKPELTAWLKQEAAIAELSAKYMPLTINGMEDAKGFKAVHEARMIVKNTRVAVEKKRVELKADALAYGKAVDSAAKRLTELLSPIEDHLEAEENAVTEAREKIKREAAEARRAKLQARLDGLAACGNVGSPEVIEGMTDSAFASYLASVKLDFDARMDAERAAAQKRKEEEEALAAERERLAAITRQQEAEAAKLAAERKRIDDEAAAKARAAELEKAKAEAAEQARVAAEKRHAEQIARDKAAAEAKAAQEKAAEDAREAARIKAEAERPQREKLILVARAIDDLPIPNGPGFDAVCAVLAKAAADVRAIANGPLA